MHLWSGCPRPILTVDTSQAERDKILALRESYFCDLKGTAIQPAKLTRTIAALSNGEGGEVYRSLYRCEEDKTTHLNSWKGFNVPEDAKGHLQAQEPLLWVKGKATFSFDRRTTVALCSKFGVALASSYVLRIS